MLRRTGSIAGARYAFTDRYGGASTAPYAELNLGDHVGDDPAAVDDNRRRLAAALELEPARLVLMRQVHGPAVAAVDGPAVCGRCYEVPRDLADQVAATVPSAAATSATGTPALDLRAGVVAQLLAAGVETIEADPWCTAESPGLFSHRRDGVTGRFAGVVVT